MCGCLMLCAVPMAYRRAHRHLILHISGFWSAAQEAYEMAYHRFFRALDRVEAILSSSRRGTRQCSNGIIPSDRPTHTSPSYS